MGGPPNCGVLHYRRGSRSEIRASRHHAAAMSHGAMPWHSVRDHVRGIRTLPPEATIHVRSRMVSSTSAAEGRTPPRKRKNQTEAASMLSMPPPVPNGGASWQEAQSTHLLPSSTASSMSAARMGLCWPLRRPPERSSGASRLTESWAHLRRWLMALSTSGVGMGSFMRLVVAAPSRTYLRRPGMTAARCLTPYQERNH